MLPSGRLPALSERRSCEPANSGSRSESCLKACPRDPFSALPDPGKKEMFRPGGDISYRFHIDAPNGGPGPAGQPVGSGDDQARSRNDDGVTDRSGSRSPRRAMPGSPRRGGACAWAAECVEMRIVDVRGPLAAGSRIAIIIDGELVRIVRFYSAGAS